MKEKKCSKKKLTKKEAEAIIKYAEISGHQYRREKRVYHCPDCNMWHTTSKDLIEHDTRKKQYIVVEQDRWEALLNNKPVIEENVIARISDGSVMIGSISTSSGVSTFYDGRWTWPEFTPLLRIRSIKHKKKRRHANNR